MNKFIADCFAFIVSILLFVTICVGVGLFISGAIHLEDPKILIGGGIAFVLLILVQGILSTFIAGYQFQKENNKYLAALAKDKLYPDLYKN